MLEAITPSDSFSNTVDTSKLTKAVYVALTAGADVLTVKCNVTGDDVDFAVGGQIWPVRTLAALGDAAAYTVVYFY